ncbi:nucleotidyltransferase family protein [uncultured Polaribacter sp.]|uniref:nucleotidyltransferase family protein n=1 Tax=uncultured Polaribacter sp. TaxID=174711 RepID=UPI0030DD1102|tara:strand:+ start:9152 stop:9742 length:591 start_codon:yes stop_codon:yes gene_type:complete
MKNIAFLVLAAGKSSRMKSIKQLEKINNKTLLDITLEKIKSICSDDIYCVLGANADIIKNEITSENIQFIENKNFESGLSSSIISGINYFNDKELKFDGVFILLADQPAIESAYLASLITLFQEHKDVIIASNYGKKLGVPAIFPERYFSELLVIKGDKGAKEFINQRKEEVMYPESTTNFFDIDTKEDLELFKNS